MLHDLTLFESRPLIDVWHSHSLSCSSEFHTCEQMRKHNKALQSERVNKMCMWRHVQVVVKQNWSSAAQRRRGGDGAQTQKKWKFSTLQSVHIFFSSPLNLWDLLIVEECVTALSLSQAYYFVCKWEIFQIGAGSGVMYGGEGKWCGVSTHEEFGTG